MNFDLQVPLQTGHDDDILDRTSRDPVTPHHSPLLAREDYHRPSVFLPENMLREARRQKGLKAGKLPPVCILDPDGDVVAFVQSRHAAKRSNNWACYHTHLYEWDEQGIRCGIVGCAVGGSFSVLVAEQLFACGCELLVSISSAGQITAAGPPPYHILIDRALRDEGTSYHYLPPSPYVEADPGMVAFAEGALRQTQCEVHKGATWTTDAPFRETEHMIAERRRDGILAVEMEAAALYAFSLARGYPVICFAHVTNRLGCVDGDFEKGNDNGAACSIALVRALLRRWPAVRRAYS